MRPGEVDGVVRGLGLQVSQLDLSNIDLGKPSGRKLRRDYKWTLILLTKLSLPVLLSIVRGPSGLECGPSDKLYDDWPRLAGVYCWVGFVTVAGGIRYRRGTVGRMLHRHGRVTSKLW